jgi:hypothetical protein
VIEKLENLSLLAVLGIFGVVAFIVIEWLKSGNVGPTDQAGQASSLLGALQGQDSVDPTSGQPTGLANSLDNYVFNESYPGGGEVANSSETYTGAATTVLSHPISSLESIFGIGSN